MRFTDRDRTNDFIRAHNHRLYRDAMGRMRRLVESLTAEERAARNSCCPEWSNQDVVAHHIHFMGADDIPEAIMTALRKTDQDAYDATRAERDGWTGAGVDARRHRTVEELWDEWDATLAAHPGAHYSTVDLTMHLFDIEESLGRTGEDRAELAFDALLGYANWFLADKLRAGDESLVLQPTDIDHTIALTGEGPVVTGTAYDLLRCVGGRRTRAEADAVLDWGGAPEAARELLSVYTWPADRQDAHA